MLPMCEDPRKELLLDRIELTNVPFVDATTGFTMLCLESQQRGLPLDEEGVGYAERPHCSTERKIALQMEPHTLFQELNLVEVGTAFANNAGGASLLTGKDCLRHSNNGEDVGFVGKVRWGMIRQDAHVRHIFDTP